MKEMDNMKVNGLRSKHPNPELQIEELFRNYDISTELIKKSTNLEELLDSILTEYIDRFDEIPGLDLVKVDQIDETMPARGKLKSLLMFASQAIVLKENAEIFDERENSNRKLRKVSNRLEKQNKQLEQMNRQYLNMLGFVSHELKSPLISILGFAELLDEGILGDLKVEQRKAISVIIRSCRLLIEMIKNYLDLTKIEQGELILDKQRLNVYKDVLSFVLEEMTEQFNRKELNVWVETDLDNIIVDCDSGLMRIVFNNLLSNAAKYSNKGGNVIIQIVQKEDFFEFTITNTGQGLKRTQLKKLFGKFTQFEVEKHSGIRSSGLGLYNAKHIIKRHGGAIWVESEFGKSFTITFSLAVALELADSISKNQAVG